MPTPIRRRFSNQTLIKDKAGVRQTLDQVMLLTNVPDAFVQRYQYVSLDDWSDVLTDGTPEYTFAQTFFGQELKPESLLIVYRDNGAAAETVATALDDAVTQQAAWYFQTYIGVELADAGEQEALSNYGESFEERVQTFIMTQDPATPDGASSTDICSTLRSTTQNRATVIYHPTTTTVLDNGVPVSKDISDERPDAGILGRMSTTEEGSEQWNYKSVQFVTDSGLTLQQQEALRTKGANFMENYKAGNQTVALVAMFPGNTCTDRDIRIQWGADWHDVSIEADMFTQATVRSELMAFDDNTFAAFTAIFSYWLAEAVRRRIIRDTEDNVIKLPDPDTIDATTRASGIANFADVYDYQLNSKIDEWDTKGTWRIA